jgi:hypothetical protein
MAKIQWCYIVILAAMLCKKKYTRPLIKTSKMSKCENIKFWAQRFSEHCDFIQDAFTASFKAKSIPVQVFDIVANLKKQWEQVKLKPILLNNECKHLLQQTLDIKKTCQDVFKALEIECWPDLFQHMQEEVLYVNDAILYGRWSFEAEAAWWAIEHAENLDFINCQLRGHNSRLISNIVSNNKALISAFKEWAKKIEVNEHMTRDLYAELMKLKSKHENGLAKLLACKDGDNKMLTHELEEAKFAANRLFELTQNNKL